MIHILVIDDHPAVREGTKSILENEDDVSVECLNPPYTVEKIQKIDFSPFDVILMDINLGDINGIELAKAIMEKKVSCKVLLYTGYDIEDYLEDAIQIGVHGAISKTESKDKILSNIRHALDGDIILPYHFVQKLILKNILKEKEANQVDPLTDREKLILIEVEKGLTNQDIADQLHLSKRSIEYSLTSIFNKLNVGSRTEAVLVAKSEGIIP